MGDPFRHAFFTGDANSMDLRASMTPAMPTFAHPSAPGPGVPSVASTNTTSKESGGRSLPFSILFASSQDEDYMATELNRGIQSRGWQSSRFCFYPQELILELSWPSRIINMQLLCHEYKIPSKVEVFVSLLSPWVHTEKAVTQMKRLGYLSLDPNDRSCHQARELKSIQVDSPAAVVRLVLHNCYTNKLNVYNQVGLVALIIMGDPLDPDSPLLTPRKEKPHDPSMSTVDSFTATRIYRLQQEKTVAIQEEDYDEAKRLKALIEKLKGLGEQVKQLELQKRAAVEAEDFDAAKICKMEIEMLRKCDGILAESLSCPTEALECSMNNTEEIWRSHVSSVHSSNGSFAPEGRECCTQTYQNSVSNSPIVLYEQEAKGITSSTHQQVVAIGLPEKSRDTSTSQFVDKRQDTSVGHSFEKLNTCTSQSTEKRLDTSISQSLENGLVTSTSHLAFAQSSNIPIEYTEKDSYAPTTHSTQVTGKQNARHSFAIPEQISPQMQMSSSTDDLSGPEPLTNVVKAECGPLINLLDLYHVQCLYSKQWQLRDKACQFVAKLLQAEKLSGDSSSFRILDSMLIRVLNDRVPNVFYGGLQLLKAYVLKYSSEIPARDLQHSSTQFINILLEKLGDSNVRSKDAAAETLMFIASKKELGLDIVAKPLLRPTKNQAIWKPVLGRLSWLLVAIPTFGVQPQSRQGFSSEMLMSYVSQAINSPNGEVRNAAVKVIIEVYKLMGAIVERYLKGIKPMIHEVLLNNFEKVALETQIAECSLTYEELENTPIPKISRKPMYDIQRALDDDIQKAISLETQSTTICELQPTPSLKKGNNAKDKGLLSMVVEQQDQLTNLGDLQTMYSTEAIVPVEKFSLFDDEEFRAFNEEANTEEEDYIEKELQIEKDELSDQCLFCGKQDSDFLVDDNLDLHFCQKCPMLVGCCNCKQIVEIASLKDHYLNECTSGRRYVECAKCSQAIPAVRMSVHLKSKECRSGKHHNMSRCPLCRHVVLPGDNGWRDHLLKPPRCPKNPRTISSF